MSNSDNVSSNTFFTIKDLSLNEIQLFNDAERQNRHVINIDTLSKNLVGIDNWKDPDLRYAGCSKKVAKLTGFKKSNDIIGRMDKEFI